VSEGFPSLYVYPRKNSIKDVAQTSRRTTPRDGHIATTARRYGSAVAYFSASAQILNMFK
jgi:hypothetical protein